MNNKHNKIVFNNFNKFQKPHLQFFIYFTELCKVFNSENTECITEAVRVLGNLTRSKISREFIIENNTVEKLISFLDKGKNY